MQVPAVTNIRMYWDISANQNMRVFASGDAQHSLLMRLHHAVAKVELEMGSLVHGSHWAVGLAIARVTGESEMIKLISGMTVSSGPAYSTNLITPGVISE